MHELIERLQSHANLSREQAEKAADVVAKFLEERVSGDQLRGLAAHLPGLSGHADKIPDNVGDQLGGALRNFMNKRD